MGAPLAWPALHAALLLACPLLLLLRSASREGTLKPWLLVALLARLSDHAAGWWREGSGYHCF